MAEDKKSFLLYADQIHTFEGLDDAEAGRLIKHLFRYVNDQNPVPPDKLTQIAFEPIKQQLKRDLEKWDEEIIKKSTGGSLGNLKRWDNDLYNLVVNKQLSLHDALIQAKERKCRIAIQSEPIQSVPIASVAVNGTVTDNVINTISSTNVELVGTADQYSKLVKDAKSITEFIKQHRPKYIGPYMDLWNLFSEKYGTSKVLASSETRKKKLKVRLSDKNFHFEKILKAATEQKFALESKWFNFDFVIENDTNYIKILEGKYATPTDTKSKSEPEPTFKSKAE